MRPVMTLALGCSLLSCSQSSQSDASVASEETRPSREDSSVFVLASIGGQDVSRSAAQSRCDDLPFYGQFVLLDSAWTSRDSSFSSCDDSEPREVVVTEGAGRLAVSSDTLDFFVSDSRIGASGLVQRAQRRGDSLLVWNSDLDGGDYMYLRRRP